MINTYFMQMIIFEKLGFEKEICFYNQKVKVKAS